jgi:hypothetical protein
MINNGFEFTEDKFNINLKLASTTKYIVFIYSVVVVFNKILFHA